jgi:DNA polymerase III epsilon subunit-like protein
MSNLKFNFNPYSDNIIFMDTEFSSLDPYEDEILSIGLVKLNGEELYLELKFSGKCNEFVEKNILPKLIQTKINKHESINQIANFVGKNKPYMISYVNQFDTVYFHKLLKSCNITTEAFTMGNFYWISIDFASILFTLNINPEIILDKEMKFFKKIGIDTEKFQHTHNALEDAKLLRCVYLKLLEYKK